MQDTPPRLVRTDHVLERFHKLQEVSSDLAQKQGHDHRALAPADPPLPWVFAAGTITE